MSTIKVHVVKGVNRYTDDLLKKQNRNINRRREVNFNVDNLNEHERSSSRAKSFAIYEPPTKFKPKPTTMAKAKASTKVYFDSNVRTKDNVNEIFKTNLDLSDEEDFTEKYEKFEDKEEVEKTSDRVPDEEDSDTGEDVVVAGYGFADQITFDHEADNEEVTDQEYNDKGDEDDIDDILGEDEVIPDDKQDKAESITIEDVFNSDNREKSIDNYGKDDNDDDGDWGYNFSSNRDQEDNASVSTASDKDWTKVFQKFRDKIKEKYDKSSFKEMHKKNMEVLRKQFKSVLRTKKNGTASQSSEDTDTGSSDYWESKADTNFNRADFTPKPYGFGGNRFHPKVLNYDSDNDTKKRCCC
ncbi:hypothetical protein MACK_001124 [Theileria orientalis]|uniref:Uncharacterized protein n=1 Tax=Theileria orientalis TaxID=68886 RepID=A0A976QX47_THEOR|nr:hypothetical protein MACK_001124 [Theileria orientalis]